MTIFDDMQSNFDSLLDDKKELQYEEASLRGLNKNDLVKICDDLEIDNEGTKKELKARILATNPEVLDVGNIEVKVVKKEKDNGSDDTGETASGDRV